MAASTELPWPLDSWWFFGGMLFVLVVLIWTISRLVPQATESTDPAEADRTMLSAITELHRQGDLNPDEFRSIKNQLVQRLAEHEQNVSTAETAEKTTTATTSVKDAQNPQNGVQESTENGNGDDGESTDSVGSNS